MKKYLFVLFFGILSFSSFAQVHLKGNYVPHHNLGVDAAPAEMTAKVELKEHLHKIFGKFTTPQRFIYLGRSEQCVKFFGEERLAELDEEEFLIENDARGNIYISGGGPRGTLYGVYWFLDRLLGVRWYTPDFTYIPKLSELDLGTLKYRQKPTFAYRPRAGNHLPYVYLEGRSDPRWTARNLLNDTQAIHGRHFIGQEFGGERVWTPPTRCHAMILLISSKDYFDKHPEWFALYQGERVGRGVASDYCLSNQELLEETIRLVRINLQKHPEARLVSIQEGDHTVAPCECENCQEMLKKYGGFESGMWLDFTNRVAERLEKEFPDAVFVTFAYDRTQKPPLNIIARPNVGVQICAWGISRGVPYADPRNTYRGNAFIANIIEPWAKICDNLLFWDYIYTFTDVFMQEPNPLINIENMQMFSKYTKLGVYLENTAEDYSNGQPFRTWLLSRAAWDPFDVDGEKEFDMFCRRYYGAGGEFVSEYWRNLREINEKQGFCHFLAGGSIGKIAADFESCETTLTSYGLLQKALKATASNPIDHARVKNVLSCVQYHLFNRWDDWEETLNEKGLNFHEIYSDLYKHLQEIDLVKGEYRLTSFMKKLESAYKLHDIKAKASARYGTQRPAYAYDGDLKTLYHSGTQSSWCQREFPEEFELTRLITVICKNTNDRANYKITGSTNGKDWFTIIDEKTAYRSDESDWIYADDKLDKPVKVKFVRTQVRKVILHDGRINDSALYEQFFNPEKLPKGLIKKKK